MSPFWWGFVISLVLGLMVYVFNGAAYAELLDVEPRFPFLLVA